MDRLAIIAMLLDGLADKGEEWELKWAISQAEGMLKDSGWVKNSIDGRWQRESA